jgi:2-amino-4-hydroxy-6-hydroxymethyldihydropteridine diphosphokinase
MPGPHAEPTADAARTTRAAVALGSNVGDRAAHLDHAVRAFGRLRSTRLVASSSVIETPPVGPPGQGPYLNAVAILETKLTARALLDALLAIESDRGRDRSREQRWGPRTLDLDLLVFGDAVIDEPGLRVPHPRLAERAFVLGPFAEVAADTVVPGIERRVGDLFAAFGHAAIVRPDHEGN